MERYGSMLDKALAQAYIAIGHDPIEIMKKNGVILEEILIKKPKNVDNPIEYVLEAFKSRNKFMAENYTIDAWEIENDLICLTYRANKNLAFPYDPYYEIH
jgi:hypothetical protein